MTKAEEDLIEKCLALEALHGHPERVPKNEPFFATKALLGILDATKAVRKERERQC